MARKRPRVEVDDDDDDDDDVVVVSENIKRRPQPQTQPRELPPDEVVVVSQNIPNPAPQRQRLPQSAAVAAVLNPTESRSILKGDTNHGAGNATQPKSTRTPMPPVHSKARIVGAQYAAGDTSANANAVVEVAPKTFECGICLDICQRRDGVALCPAKCVFCRPCVARQLRVSASSRQFPINCAGCELELDPWAAVAEIKWQDGGERVADIIAQMAVQAGMTTIRYCSNEKCSMPYEYEGNSGIKARVFCPVCHVKSCVRCSKPWHDGPCNLSNIAGAEDARPCPECGALCIKMEGGCNAITCHCGTPFCFACGGRYDDFAPYCECH